MHSLLFGPPALFDYLFLLGGSLIFFYYFTVGIVWENEQVLIIHALEFTNSRSLLMDLKIISRETTGKTNAWFQLFNDQIFSPYSASQLNWVYEKYSAVKTTETAGEGIWSFWSNCTHIVKTEFTSFAWELNNRHCRYKSTCTVSNIQQSRKSSGCVESLRLTQLQKKFRNIRNK